LPDPLYCIDTSALIAGHKELYPIANFPNLWRRIEEMIIDDRLIAPDEVLLELEKRDDDTRQWAADRSNLFQPLTPDVQQILSTRVAVDFAGWIDPNKLPPWADPLIISLAVCRGATVVTEEKWSNSPQMLKWKIPNICKPYNVRCVSFLKLIQDHGWSF
jgi:hypothetical protein